MTDRTLFFSYAQEDEPLLIELKKHLQPLKRQGLITDWYDHNIAAGLEWMQERADQLNSATIIALLISPDYLDSEYTYGIEMHQAMQRHEAGSARILPIFLRPVLWEGTPFAKLKPLPTDARPITAWEDRDRAFADVAAALLTILKAIQAQQASHPDQPVSTLTPSQRPAQLFTVPFLRDPFFTGRAEILTRLHAMLASDQPTALTQPPAISGLGGIGKTQTAIEYAYQQRATYSHILWIRSETQQEIISDYTLLASTLHLPEENAPDQNIIVNAVKRWLETTPGWLLIFDNADDLELAAQYFPARSAHEHPGRILLTTRAQTMSGLAHKIDLQTMATEEGALLLLRRASLLGPKDPIEQASPGDITTARQIAHELDGLPLALNQAGAYIEEKQCGLTRYLELYRAHPAQLLQKRGQPAKFFGHPDPVATTWQLSFKNIEAANPAAAELLRLCAFLAPDAIPEEIFTEGASELGPTLQPIAADPLALNDSIGELLKYSLVRRDPVEQTLTIHRLVQKVLVDGMDEETQRLWGERCVKAVCNTFPNAEFEIWPECERLLSQGQTCISLIEQWDFSFKEAALLLSRVGFYLKERHGQLREVEALYRGAYEMYERMLGEEHPDTLTTLNNLAGLYEAQGKHREAQELYEQVRVVRERVLGVEHPSTAVTLYNLAVVYEAQGRYAEAEELYRRVLAIDEKVYGLYHREIVTDLRGLVGLYQVQGRDEEVRVFLERVADIEGRL